MTGFILLPVCGVDGSKRSYNQDPAVARSDDPGCGPGLVTWLEHVSIRPRLYGHGRHVFRRQGSGQYRGRNGQWPVRVVAGFPRGLFRGRRASATRREPHFRAAYVVLALPAFHTHPWCDTWNHRSRSCPGDHQSGGSGAVARCRHASVLASAPPPGHRLFDQSSRQSDAPGHRPGPRADAAAPPLPFLRV